MRKNILITGIPKSGKSTLLKKIIQKFDHKVGFVTHEVRKDGERVGFEIETSGGRKSMIAHIDFKTDLKVSKYAVDINNLDILIPRIENFQSGDLLFLDEIGQMQLFSDKFKKLVIQYFDASNTCVATISKVYDDEFTKAIKERNDIILVEITDENRDTVEKYVEALLKKIEKAKRYCSEPERFTVSDGIVNIATDHGVRTLKKQGEQWGCNCDFFQEHSMCSHLMALEEYSKR